MKDLIHILHRVLTKYNLVWNASKEYRKYIINTRKSTLIESLKGQGAYSIFYHTVISLNIYLRKLGLKLSIIQSKIVISTILLITIISASIIILTNFKPLNDEISTLNHATDRKIKIIKNTLKPKTENININYYKNPEIEYRIGIETFSGIEKNISQKTTDIYFQQMTKIIGPERIVKLNQRNLNKSINYILTGSVMKLNTKYMVNSKIIDAETSKIIFLSSDEIKNIKELSDLFNKYSKEILKKIKKR